MDSQPENFENLRRLLALKRHEQPPPGFFDGFSRAIYVRLQGGEAAQPVGWERVAWEAPWLVRLWDALSVKPLLTGAMGVAASAMVLAGVLSAEGPDLPVIANNGLTPTVLAGPAPAEGMALHPMLVSSSFGSDTNSSIQPAIPSSLFGGSIHPERVTWPPKGN